jgi:hypothetical protein
MISPGFWTFLETYKEFITNGLDLLGVLLGIPFIIRFVLPALYKIVNFAYSNIIILVFVISGPRLPDDVSGHIGISLLVISYYVGVLIIFGTAAYTFWRFRKYTPTPLDDEGQLTRYAAVLAAALLLVSRVIAFVVAAHDLPA